MLIGKRKQQMLGWNYNTGYTLPPAFHGKIWPGSCRADGNCRSGAGAESRAVCRVIAAPLLRPRRCTERTGAAGGGERKHLVAGGNSGELERRMPEGRVAGRASRNIFLGGDSTNGPSDEKARSPVVDSFELPDPSDRGED